MVEDRTPLYDPNPLREEVPELLREAGLPRSGRTEEEEVRAGDDRGDDVLVGRLGEHGAREERRQRLGAVEPLLAKPVDRYEGPRRGTVRPGSRPAPRRPSGPRRSLGFPVRPKFVAWPPWRAESGSG